MPAIQRSVDKHKESRYTHKVKTPDLEPGAYLSGSHGGWINAWPHLGRETKQESPCTKDAVAVAPFAVYDDMDASDTKYPDKMFTRQGNVFRRAFCCDYLSFLSLNNPTRLIRPGELEVLRLRAIVQLKGWIPPSCPAMPGIVCII